MTELLVLALPTAYMAFTEWLAKNYTWKEVREAMWAVETEGEPQS